MNAWWPFYFNPDVFRLPFSGNVEQDISPLTNWFSPQVELNFSGNKNIEAAVISEVASYGKQLGILNDAVLALAGDNDHPAIQRLSEITAQIEKVKDRCKADQKSVAKEQLDRLLKNDPEALKELLAQYSVMLQGD